MQHLGSKLSRWIGKQLHHFYYDDHINLRYHLTILFPIRLMEPLNSGSYPVEMVSYLGERLPKFSEEQSAMLKNSFDFIGINYYSTAYAADAECPSQNKTYLTDYCAKLTCKMS